MSLECLPTVIKDSLLTIIELEFSAGWTANAKEVKSSNGGTAYTVVIQCGTRLWNLFIKCLSKCDDSFQSIEETYFNNELVFYGELLGCFFEIEKRSKVNIPFTSVPKCITVGSDKVPFIIMNNLVEHGYKNLDLKYPLNLQCCRLVLQQVARFHAFSFAFKDQEPNKFKDVINKFQETVFSEEHRSSYGKLFLHSIHDALKLAKQALPKSSIYVEKLAIFTLNIFDVMSNLAQCENTYSVITHGDLWPNNILCKFDKETNFPEDAAFIDFQGCRYSSPIHDIMYIILLSIDKSTRDEFREDLLLCYYSSLCEKLEELGSDPHTIFPYSAFETELYKHARFSLAMALVGLPLHMDDGPIAENHNNTRTQIGAVDSLVEFVQSISARKTIKCKHKMLEIIMDCVDQGYI